MYWDLRSDFSLDFLLFLLSVIAFQIPCMLLWSSVALTAFCDPPFHFSFALSLLSFVSMLANEDPLSKVCCNQKMPLFYFIFVFCFFLSFPLFLLLLHFSVPFVCLFFSSFFFFSFLVCLISLRSPSQIQHHHHQQHSGAGAGLQPPALPHQQPSRLPSPWAAWNGGLSPLCPPSFCPPAQPQLRGSK